MGSFCSTKLKNIFINNSTTSKILKNLLTVHIVIHNGGKMLTYAKAWSITCKIQNLSEKYVNIESTNCISWSNQTYSRKKGPRYCVLSFYSKEISMLNELVIKKIRQILFLWRSFTCLMDKSHYEKTEPFPTKCLSH